MDVETRDAIVAEIAGDRSFQTIGETYGFNVSTIRRLARANGFNAPRAYHIVKVSPQRQTAAERRDALAEHMAEGGTLKSFSDSSGLRYRSVQYMWETIRAGLGAQAV
jgi:transposase InsO family protein